MSALNGVTEKNWERFIKEAKKAEWAKVDFEVVTDGFEAYGDVSCYGCDLEVLDGMVIIGSSDFNVVKIYRGNLSSMKKDRVDGWKLQSLDPNGGVRVILVQFFKMI